MSDRYLIPILCTRGVIVFPSQEVNIDVGRKESIDACQLANDHNSYIYVVSQKLLETEDPKPEDLYDYGTLCKIQRYRKKDNYIRVGLVGVARAKALNFMMHEGVKSAEVQVLNDNYDDETLLKELIAKVLVNFEKIKNHINPGMNVELFKNLRSGLSAGELTDYYAQVFLFDYRDKERFLEETTIIERLKMTLEFMKKQIEADHIEKEIDDKVRSSLEDNQRDYFLREKMRAIKEELNEGHGFSDTDELRNQIENNPYPEHVKAKALDELAKLEMLPAASGESGVIRTYLDWLLKTPWYQKTEDNDDLNEAKKILDEDHFGLDKIKERILEYLAVKQMTKSLKSPIICLVGPPGVGKTSLAKSVARALDRKFVKISLGGVRDEAEIRGHRRTYLGALPGRIIQGMKKAEVINPVFLIDEIDKMASDYKGDPSSAMLEVLDPEQNSSFSDHYLEEPYDLSDVLFIATANYIENIPAALKDRLEIINLSSYTELEKVEIAKRHLVRKQLAANGLKATQFVLSDEMIMYLIRHYTREAGVRQLERVIGSLCRKSVLAILAEGKKKVSINKKLINEWLGAPMFEYGAKEKENQVGVVTGLAYTSFGGDILSIEVNYFEGNGKFIVTGQLGDVMKESTRIALDYIKANAKKYHIDPKFFETHDIHIHVPEGAVPKDGPSAGVTLTTAIVSAITNTPVFADLAMTGEVTLRGNVLAIGGLKEKSLAAHRAGISKIIFPKNNKKDLAEVPDSVKDEIKFIPVDNVDAVLRHALIKQ